MDTRIARGFLTAREDTRLMALRALSPAEREEQLLDLVRVLRDNPELLSLVDGEKENHDALAA